MSDIPTTHTLPEDALRMMRTAFRMDPRSARCLEDAEAAITRLREHAAGLALERDGFQEESKRLRADLAAAQEREQRMREALANIMGNMEPDPDDPDRRRMLSNGFARWEALEDDARAALSAMRGEP